MEQHCSKEPTPYVDIIKHIFKKEIKLKTEQENLVVETWDIIKNILKANIIKIGENHALCSIFLFGIFLNRHWQVIKNPYVLQSPLLWLLRTKYPCYLLWDLRKQQNILILIDLPFNA